MRVSMRAAAAAIAAAVVFTSASAMAAGSSAGYGGGGRFARFDPIVDQYNKSGEVFRITGNCQSACTLFLAIRNVCIEPGAQLRFHAGRGSGGQASSTSRSHMLSAYNEKLRAYLGAHHAMETEQFFTISGRDMISKFGYRRCGR
jgi:hypothetical protein